MNLSDHTLGEFISLSKTDSHCGFAAIAKAYSDGLITHKEWRQLAETAHRKGISYAVGMLIYCI